MGYRRRLVVVRLVTETLMLLQDSLLTPTLIQVCDHLLGC